MDLVLKGPQLKGTKAEPVGRPVRGLVGAGIQRGEAGVWTCRVRVETMSEESLDLVYRSSP